MLKVKKVLKNKIAKYYGFQKGDVITHFNGEVCEDVLDYLYYNAEQRFSVTVLTRQNTTVTIQVEKGETEDFGLIFEDDNMAVKTCRNKCIFCFVDQMPKGMRSTLYVKDDDYRQSFLYGNFVTLTNVTDSDLKRIVRLNLSPLYVSVHATDKTVREKMLNNRFAGNVLKQLKFLTQNGIKIHAQIVLVPSVNDGAILDKSLKDLYELSNNILSVAVVPCGITKHREGLYKIEDIEKGYSDCVINQVMSFNAKINKNFAVLGDEFYFKAKKNVENYAFYGDFSQIGNGVGTTAKFLNEFNGALKISKNAKKYLVITGTSACDLIAEKVMEIEKISQIKAEVIGVKNNFFGETVNCTGLLTGKDILNQVKLKCQNFDYIVLPGVCLKGDEDVFLDGVTLKQLKKELKKPIIVTDGSGESFFDALSGGKRVRIIK